MVVAATKKNLVVTTGGTLSRTTVTMQRLPTDMVWRTGAEWTAESSKVALQASQITDARIRLGKFVNHVNHFRTKNHPAHAHGAAPTWYW